MKDFFQFPVFSEASWKVKNKINARLRSVSSFSDTSWKFKKKMNAKRNVLSQPWHWKAMKDFFQFPVFFLKLHEKNKNKINPRRKHFITDLALKSNEGFLPFFWSYMKSQEQNQCKKKMLYHSLSIKKPLKISSSFQVFLKLHEKSRTKSMQDFF